MHNNLHLFNKGIKVKPRTKVSIYQSANKLRQILGIDIHQPFDILYFLEITLQKGTNYKFNFVPKSKEYMGDIEAAVSPDEKLMKIRQDVWEALYDDDPRARFTIAHEFGHYFLHKGVPFNRGNPTAHKTYEDSEWQANTFAAELLAPLEGCHGLTVEEIMDKYEISRQCAALRYKECNSR